MDTASEAAMGLPGHPGWVHARRKRLCRGGGAGRSSAARGQVQTVLQRTEELASGAAQESWISAARRCVCFCCKTQLFRVVVVLGAAVQESGPQASPDLPD